MRFGRALALPGGVTPRRWHAPASLGLPPHRHRPHARTRAPISLTRHAARSHGPHRIPSVPPNRVKSATYRPLTKNAVSDTVVERVETCFVLIFQQLRQATAPLRGRRESPQKWPENPPNGHGSRAGPTGSAPRFPSLAPAPQTTRASRRAPLPKGQALLSAMICRPTAVSSASSRTGAMSQSR